MRENLLAILEAFEDEIKRDPAHSGERVSTAADAIIDILYPEFYTVGLQDFGPDDIARQIDRAIAQISLLRNGRPVSLEPIMIAIELLAAINNHSRENRGDATRQQKIAAA